MRDNYRVQTSAAGLILMGLLVLGATGCGASSRSARRAETDTPKAWPGEFPKGNRLLRETSLPVIRVAYPTLADAPGPIDVVDFVTPPGVTLKVLDDVAALGLPAVFLQDGSWDEDVIRKVSDASYRAVYDACIMVVTA